jgi:hypothetical protein
MPFCSLYTLDQMVECLKIWCQDSMHFCTSLRRWHFIYGYSTCSFFVGSSLVEKVNCSLHEDCPQLNLSENVTMPFINKKMNLSENVMMRFINKEMNSHWRGRISNALNQFLQEFLCLVKAIILMVCFFLWRQYTYFCFLIILLPPPFPNISILHCSGKVWKIS